MEEREAPAPRPRRYARYRPNAFQLGQVVSRSFSVWGRSVVTLVLLALLAMAPMLAWAGYRVATGAVQHSPFASDHRDFVVEILTMTGEFVAGQICGALANAMVVFAVFRRLRDEQPSFEESIRGGLRRLPAVLGVIVLSTVVYYGAPLAVLGVAFTGADGATLAAVGILVGLAWIVPLFWLVVSWWVAVPAVVIERPGVIGALGRSMRLTRGHRWHILVLILLIAGVGMGVGLVGGILVGVSPAAGVVAMRLIAVVLASLNGTFVAVTYHDLRREKEGTPADEMAQVFA